MTGRKKFIRRYAKYLIEHEPDAWTPIRYVSADEIEKNTRYIESEVGFKIKGILVIRENTLGLSNIIEGKICCPGYYRVSKDLHPVHGTYLIACAGGFPYHHANGSWKRFKSHESMKQRGRLKQRELQERTERIERAEREMEFSSRAFHTEIDKREAIGFFQMLAVAGAVEGEA